MLSGQWEVVGKNKKDKQAANAQSVNNVRNSSSERKPNPKTGKENKPINPEKKIIQKKNIEKKQEKTKQKPHKSIEAALQSLDSEELAIFITTNRLRFEGAPLIWLKELASYLNQRLTSTNLIDDITVKPPSFPLGQVNSAARNVLENILKDVGTQNITAFYENTLTSIGHDMSRDQPVCGYLLLVQLIASHNPELCTQSISRATTLKGSYVNRPPIFKSILWSIGQGGYKKLDVGLNVWQELMLPVMEMKHYTKYTVNYLSTLLDHHNNTKSVLKLSNEQYISIYDAINTKKTTLTKDINLQLTQQLPKLRKLYFSSNPTKLQVCFNQLLQRVSIAQSNKLDLTECHLMSSLIDCLSIDDSCHMTWRQLFNKCGKQTSLFLTYIDNNWMNVCEKINMKSLKSTLELFIKSSQDNLRSKKKDENLLNVIKFSENIMGKIKKQQSKKTKSSSKLMLMMFVILTSITGLLTYDIIHADGVFNKSKTGQLLESVGALETVESIGLKTLSFASKGLLWVDSNAPPAWNKTVTVITPYSVLVRDVFQLGAHHANNTYYNVRAYVVEKSPVVHRTIDHYVPGALDAIQGGARSVYTTISQHTHSYYNNAKHYLQSKVFVGEWAPEILHDKTLKALNNTRLFVTDYYAWIHERANIYSKLQ